MHTTVTPHIESARTPRTPRKVRKLHKPRMAVSALAAVVALALPLAVATRAQSQTSPKAPDAKAQVRTLDLPFEKIAYEKSTLPGYQLTVQQCSICHSPEYVTYQPRTSPRAYWQATVDKMVKTFGAPLPAEQVAPIVDYLTKTYGAEAPKPAEKPAEKP